MGCKGSSVRITPSRPKIPRKSSYLAVTGFFCPFRAWQCGDFWGDFFQPAFLLSIVSAGPLESVADILLASSISLPSSAAE